MKIMSSLTVIHQRDKCVKVASELLLKGISVAIGKQGCRHASPHLS